MAADCLNLFVRHLLKLENVKNFEKIQNFVKRTKKNDVI